MKIGIIDEYDIDLIETLKFLNFEFYYFLFDSEERRRYYNIFLLPFSELEKYYKELDFVLNLSDLKLDLEKVINKIDELSLIDREKMYVYRIERSFFDNVIYFPYVINNNIPEVKIEKIFENKNRKVVLVLCDKISLEAVGIMTLLSKEFEIYIYGILDLNTSNSKGIYFLKRKLEKNELIKLLKYVDIVIDFSKNKFYKELLYAALLNKPIFTVKDFKNFPKLVIDEKINEKINKLIKKNYRYDISENLIENSKKIIEEELFKLSKKLIKIKNINY
ncbi:MAG: hypothetical protein QXO40_01795 [Candidatus Aenigmatarchaeota archaeon]